MNSKEINSIIKERLVKRNKLRDEFNKKHEELLDKTNGSYYTLHKNEQKLEDQVFYITFSLIVFALVLFRWNKMKWYWYTVLGLMIVVLGLYVFILVKKILLKKKEKQYEKLVKEVEAKKVEAFKASEELGSVSLVSLILLENKKLLDESEDKEEVFKFLFSLYVDGYKNRYGLVVGDDFTQAYEQKILRLKQNEK